MVVVPAGMMRDFMRAHPRRCSLYCEAVAEAEKHKWIESEKAGRDLGRAAVEEWNMRHWPGYCRCRWLQHLRGEVHWAEFGDSRFGALHPDRWPDRNLLERVVKMVERGQENLEILTWAVHARVDLGTVVDILEIMDINSLRDRRIPAEHIDAVR